MGIVSELIFYSPAKNLFSMFFHINGFKPFIKLDIHIILILQITFMISNLKPMPWKRVQTKSPTAGKIVMVRDYHVIILQCQE